MKYVVVVSIIVMGLHLVGCAHQHNPEDEWWYSGDIPSDVTLR